MNPFENQLMFHTTRIKQVIVDDLDQLQQHFSIPEQLNYQEYIQQRDFSQQLVSHEKHNHQSKHNNEKSFKKSVNSPPSINRMQKPVRKKIREKKIESKMIGQTINLEMLNKNSVNKILKNKSKKHNICEQAVNSFHKKNNKSVNIQKSNKIKSPSPQLYTYRDTHSNQLVPHSITKNNYFSDEFTASIVKNNKFQTTKKRTKSFLQSNNISKRLKNKANGQHICSKKTTKIKQQISFKPDIQIQRIISILKSNNSLYISDNFQQSQIDIKKQKKILLTQCSEELIKDMKKTKQQVIKENVSHKNDHFIIHNKEEDNQQRCNTQNIIQMYIAMINQKVQFNQGIIIQANDKQKQRQLSISNENSKGNSPQKQLIKQQDLKLELKKWQQMLQYFKQNVQKSENNLVSSCLQNFLRAADKQLKEILCKKFGNKQILKYFKEYENSQDISIKSQDQEPIEQEKCIDNSNHQHRQSALPIHKDYHTLNQQNQYEINKKDTNSKIYEENLLLLNDASERENTSQFSSTQDFSENDAAHDLIRISSIDRLLKQQIQQLKEQRDKDISNLENQYEEEIIICSNYPEFQQEKNKLLKWYKIELKYLNKARKDIWKGYNQFKKVLDKAVPTKKLQTVDKHDKILRCLSAQYLLRKRRNYYQEKYQKQEQKNQKIYKNQKQLKQEDFTESIDKIRQKLQEIKESNKFNTPKQQKQASLEFEQVNQNFPDQSNSLSRSSHLNLQQHTPQQIALEDDNAIQQLQLNEKQNKDYSGIQKLKYMSYEDKEDIFEFIFLDLCIELYQEHCHQNAIMKSVNEFIENQQAKKSRKKGVKTSLTVVKEYLKRFQAFVLRTNRSCLISVNTPIGPSAFQMLRYLRQTDYLIDEQDNLVSVVIPLETFDKFESILLSSIQIEKINQDDQQEEKRQQFLKNVLHIHNKAVFDCLNEYLDLQRPFKLMGTPFPWKTSTQMVRQISEQQAMEKLLRASNNVVDTCSYICGILLDKEDSLFGNSKNISQDYIESLRQDRLSRMLANDLLQNETRWLFIDDEQAEVLMEIYRYVSKNLLEEIIFQLKLILNS